MDPASNSSDDNAAGAPLVLVVDDSPTMCRSVQLTLQATGYRVAVAGDGHKALQLIDRGPRPDLMLTDILMPGMDGLTLITLARQRLRFTPIVALTTQSQQHLRDQGRAAGATAWLIKPTGGRELVALVQRFLSRSPAGAPVP